MKKAITLLTGILLFTNCFSQEVSLKDSITTDYLQKSKNQRTAAWVMLGGGVALITLAGAVAEPIKYNICLFCENQPPQPERNDALPNTLAIAGLASILGSIPMFIVAHHTRTKTSSIGFKEQPIFLPGKDGSVYHKTQLAVVYKLQL